jgi:hypothetical protein
MEAREEGEKAAGSALVPLEVTLAPQPPRFVLWGQEVAGIAFLPRANGAADGRLEQGWSALCEGAPDPPPPFFEDLGALVAYLETRRHVGALAIGAPSAYFDDSGTPVAIRFSLLGARLGAGWIAGEHNVGAPADRVRHEVSVHDGMLRIMCWQRFALPNPLDPRGRFELEAPRPLGWIQLTVDFDREGRVQTHLGCSYLPSVCFYREGIRVHRVEARHRSRSEVLAVLAASAERPSGTTYHRLEAISYLQPFSPAAF